MCKDTCHKSYNHMMMMMLLIARVEWCCYEMSNWQFWIWQAWQTSKTKRTSEKWVRKVQNQKGGRLNWCQVTTMRWEMALHQQRVGPPQEFTELGFMLCDQEQTRTLTAWHVKGGRIWLRNVHESFSWWWLRLLTRSTHFLLKVTNRITAYIERTISELYSNDLHESLKIIKLINLKSKFLEIPENLRQSRNSSLRFAYLEKLECFANQ